MLRTLHHTVDILDVTANATVTIPLEIHLRNEWRFRLGVWLIGLGCRIANIGINFEGVNDGES